MASIDKLEIEISVDSAQAEKDLDSFAKSLMNLRKASNISASSMGQFANSAKSASSSSNGFSRLFGTINRGANSSSKSMKSLAYYFGKFYANFWLLRRGIGVLKGAVNYASDLAEVQNVVDNVFGDARGQVEDFAKESIKNFGLSELSAKQFASRYQAMGSAMGITNAQVEKSNATWNAVSDVYDNTANSMADMSINLTKLTADLGSFYNMDYSEVATKLESIFTGQTRPLILAA